MLGEWLDGKVNFTILVKKHKDTSEEYSVYTVTCLSFWSKSLYFLLDYEF